MNQYTIYCTEGQTKKALELGAPIITFGYGDLGDAEDNILKMNRQAVLSREDNNSITVGQIPTAEQMLGWLEEQYGLHFQTSQSMKGYHVWVFKGGFIVRNSNNEHIHTFSESRKQATLAAIDAALEYLISHKK